MMRNVHLRFVIFLAMLLATCAGCGGDAYEQQFDKSMRHLKATGQPLPRSGEEPAPVQEGQAPNGQGANQAAPQ